MGHRLEIIGNIGFKMGQGLVGFGNENKGENQDLSCCKQLCEQ